VTKLGWGLADIRVDRVIYTTITLMSILIVYDGWATLTFKGVAAVIVGPMLCIFLGHVFGAGMGMRVEQGRTLNRDERRDILIDESRFLLLLVPPLGILCLLWAVGVDYTEIIQVIVGVGVLSLGFWGGVAGKRAHLTGWSFVLSVAYGLLMGSVILALQAFLRPGEGTLQALAALAGT
jgi:hypothetical protein